MRLTLSAVLVVACLAAAPLFAGAVAAQGMPGGHRHARKADDSKPRPADTPAKPIVPETEAQHRAYLNQYGFGLK